MKALLKTIQTFLTRHEEEYLQTYLEERGLSLRAWHREVVRKAIKNLRKETSKHEKELIEQTALREAKIEAAFK